MREFSTGDLNKQVGDVTDAATREPILLTRHKKPRFVLMSFEHYERMLSGANMRQAWRTTDMPAEHKAIFDEALQRIEDGTGYDDDA